MDARLPDRTWVPVLRALDDALGSSVEGLYVGGSVAFGDFRRGVSDIDAVALLDRPADPTVRRALVAIHRRLEAAPLGPDLHCTYVSRRHVADPARWHWTWAFGELFRRPFSGIGRAELLAPPVVFRGPAPAEWLAPMGPDDLRAAARGELAGYWTAAVRKRSIWQQDVYVDHGLTTVARADLTIRDGRLVTKSEAIGHLRELGLAPELVDGVHRRRHGETVAISAAQRDARAEAVRRFVRAEITRLST